MLEKGGGERRRVVDGWGDGFVNTAQSLRGRVEKGSFGVGVSVGGGDGVSGVAQDVQQTNVVETKARYKSVLNKTALWLRQLGRVFIVVADNRQNLTR